MASMIVLRSVRTGPTSILRAGSTVDDSTLDTTLFVNALWPASDATVAAAAAKVMGRRLGGGIDEPEAEKILADAVSATQRFGVVADGNVLGGVPVVHIVDVPDAATGNVDVVITKKTEVLDVQVMKKAGAGGAGDLITVKNGATAITDDIDINIADKVSKRAATLDDAQTVIAAGGTLRVTRTKASAANTACRVIVYGVLRA